jgi:putative Mn2+ efflux pump MntP
MIPEKVEELSQFIDETQDLLAKVLLGIGIQMCESFHSCKDKLAPKDFDWQGPWKARVTGVVLDINPPGW